LRLENAQNDVLNAHIEGVTKAQTAIYESACMRTTYFGISPYSVYHPFPGYNVAWGMRVWLENRLCLG